MLIKSVAAVVTSAALLLLSVAAVASPTLVGSFAGIAAGSRFDGLSPNAVDFDGEVVTGTFSLDLAPAPYYTIDGPDRTYSVYPSGSVLMTFFAHGQVVDFGGAFTSGSVELDTETGTPRLTIDADEGNPYHNSLLVLTGPLFDALGIGTLHAADVDLSRSAAGFFQSRAFGSSVTLTNVTFASSVPEPATVWMMIAGLAGVMAAVAKRRAQQGRPYNSVRTTRS